jgi:hypothetical protein
MNRIILIGNGFDLAHGLPTRYQDFMDSYWADFAKKYPDSSPSSPCKDGFVKLEKIEGTKPWTAKDADYNDFLNNVSIDFTEGIKNVKSYKDLKQLIKEATKYPASLRFELSFKNGFWQHISEKTCLEKWVDIEDEYYRQLKEIYGRRENPPCKINVETLNAELKIIKEKLITYLSEIQKEKITGDIVIEQIREKIYGKIDIRDISNSGQDLFLDGLFSEVSNLPGGMCAGEIEEEMREHPEYYIMNTGKEAYREMIKDKLSKGELGSYLLPNRTLLLNFNYTNTAGKLYKQSADEDECELIHIHGELDNPVNPVIFGYGDEMDEHYKKILDLNDNGYLQNIKSIHYLETDNYRKLLAFANSAPYQIYIMGHSCGNSDRTLLNTLFEHKNCLSVKPYYHQKEDGTDNYIDIVQNISRNFKNMAMMRDRVVNKDYCKPLVSE